MSTALLHNNLLNTPHLCTTGALDDALGYLESRKNGRAIALSSSIPKDSSSRVRFDTANKVGFLEIRGSLVHKHSLLSSACGMISYRTIEKDFDQLLDRGAKTVVLVVDSPGGIAYGCFETAALLRKKADKRNVKIITYVDGIASSAAYALASSSHQIIANPDSEVGSIGVVVRLQNDSGAEKKAGRETTYIYAGNSKVPFSPDGSFSKSFLDDMQIKVQKLYADFCQFVSVNRKMSVKTVSDTQAKTFLAKDALSIGLIDRVMTRDEFEKYLNTGKVVVSTQPTAVSKSVNPSITKSTPTEAAHKKPDAVREILKTMFPARGKS